MKKHIFTIALTLLSISAFSQVTVKIDSTKVNADSVTRYYYSIIIPDTLTGNATKGELMANLKTADEQIKFLDQTLIKQVALYRDSLKTDTGKKQVEELIKYNQSALNKALGQKYLLNLIINQTKK